MNKRKGSFSAVLITVVVLALLGATAYLGTAALAERKAAVGERLLSDEEYTGAFSAFKEAEKYNKYVMRKNPRVTEGLAKSSEGLEDYDAALDYYLQLAKDEPGNVRTQYSLGQLYVRAKDYGKAEEHIKTLEEIGGAEAEAYAAELEDMVRESAIKGIFKDIYDRLAPSLPKLPDLSDNFEVKPSSRDNDRLENHEPGTDDDSKDDTGENRQENSI